MLLLSRKEKENLVIELDKEGKTTREIAKAVHISLKDIGKIIHKVTGDDESSDEKEKVDEKKQKRLKSLSPYLFDIFYHLYIRLWLIPDIMLCNCITIAKGY